MGSRELSRAELLAVVAFLRTCHAMEHDDVFVTTVLRAVPRLGASGRNSHIARAFGAIHPEVVVFDQSGALVFVGDRARELLGVDTGSEGMPAEILFWARAQLRQLARGPARPLSPIAVSDGRVRVRPFACNGGLVLAVETWTPHDGERFRLPELTSRENEVLYWVAAGKTNEAIAAILGVASKTIEKHLAHVYAKLEVPNRAAAVASALTAATIAG